MRSSRRAGADGCSNYPAMPNFSSEPRSVAGNRRQAQSVSGPRPEKRTLSTGRNANHDEPLARLLGACGQLPDPVLLISTSGVRYDQMRPQFRLGLEAEHLQRPAREQTAKPSPICLPGGEGRQAGKPLRTAPNGRQRMRCLIRLPDGFWSLAALGESSGKATASAMLQTADTGRPSQDDPQVQAGRGQIASATAQPDEETLLSARAVCDIEGELLHPRRQ